MYTIRRIFICIYVYVCMYPYLACTCMYNMYVHILHYCVYNHGNFMYYFKHVSYNNIHENTMKLMEISAFFVMNFA